MLTKEMEDALNGQDKKQQNYSYLFDMTQRMWLLGRRRLVFIPPRSSRRREWYDGVAVVVALDCDSLRPPHALGPTALGEVGGSALALRTLGVGGGGGGARLHLLLGPPGQLANAEAVVARSGAAAFGKPNTKFKFKSSILVRESKNTTF